MSHVFPPYYKDAKCRGVDLSRGVGKQSLTPVNASGLRSADECTPCPRGSYCSAGQRNACPQGSYNEAAGQAASTACVSCMPRASTATEASTSEAGRVRLSTWVTQTVMRHAPQ